MKNRRQFVKSKSLPAGFNRKNNIFFHTKPGDSVFQTKKDLQKSNYNDIF